LFSVAPLSLRIDSSPIFVHFSFARFNFYMTESSEKPTPVPTQSEPASAHSYLGSLLKDRYLIEREIGRGGLGAVYLAR
jgi:hypothetical protein